VRYGGDGRCKIVLGDDEGRGVGWEKRREIGMEMGGQEKESEKSE